MTYYQKTGESWTDKMKRKRGERAVARQLEYQRIKSKGMAGHEKLAILSIKRRAVVVKEKLEQFREIRPEDRFLEVGSGAHGLVFGFNDNFAVGLDPLAVEYKQLFPMWQGTFNSIAAIGESLPFGDESFDVVLSDNVVDHASDPVGIIRELVRVLSPTGVLYFTVNTHHPIYEAVSIFHGYWNALGLKFEITPFADHTVHFTQGRVASIFEDLPVQVRSQATPLGDSGGGTSRGGGVQNRIRRVFKKNVLYEVIATKKPSN